ncbi:MAG: class I SAM-dependent methyltransferase [Thermoplasmata archaeon]|nr:MAG: class I SAM-dependent methyltransferase [Thermoplasmata archaeon]
MEHKVQDDQPWWDYLWLHEMICKEAKYCLGVDKGKEELKKLKERGYKVKYADVETMDLGRKFDVVVAGELIEHLNNPGLFLERVNSHLKPNGIVILTTPNAFSLQTYLRVLLGMDKMINLDHVNYYHPQTLTELLKRYNFKVEEVFWHVRPKTTRLMVIFKFKRDIVPYFIIVARKIKGLEAKPK